MRIDRGVCPRIDGVRDPWGDFFVRVSNRQCTPGERVCVGRRQVLGSRTRLVAPAAWEADSSRAPHIAGLGWRFGGSLGCSSEGSGRLVAGKSVLAVHDTCRMRLLGRRVSGRRCGRQLSAAQGHRWRVCQSVERRRFRRFEGWRQRQMARDGRIPTIQTLLPLLEPAARCTLHAARCMLLAACSPALNYPLRVPASSPRSLTTVVVASALPVFSPCQL